MKTGLSPSSEGKCPREMQRCRALCRNLWLMAAYRLWPQAMYSLGADVVCYHVQLSPLGITVGIYQLKYNVESYIHI